MADQDLIDKLIPDYAPFSRRPVVDNGWYKALTRDNVELVTDPHRAAHAERASRPTTAPCYDVDVIVTATGFDVDASTSGRPTTSASDGVDLHDCWSKDGPRAYLSMMVPDFPNMFMLYGPNSQPVSGGTACRSGT